MAGNLADLGNIFGVGCGKQYDLTYDGTANWLNGIPLGPRACVYYHTTSFTDRRWRHDYCQLTTNILLDDPEDGVTERSKGQLPGGNNMDHKTGWCHTSGMSDPNQISDSSRNSDTMANASSHRLDNYGA